MSKSKQVGTAAETAVVTYLRAHGFAQAERRALAGAADLGDVVGCPGLVVEVKGGKAAERASDGQVDLWLAETETERINARADIGVLVMKRAGIGAARAGQWWAVLTQRDFLLLAGIHSTSPAPVRVHLSTAVALLRAGGYGTEIAA